MDYVEEEVHKLLANNEAISLKRIFLEIKIMSILLDRPEMVAWLQKYLDILAEKNLIEVRHGVIYQRRGPERT